LGRSARGSTDRPCTDASSLFEVGWLPASVIPQIRGLCLFASKPSSRALTRGSPSKVIRVIDRLPRGRFASSSARRLIPEKAPSAAVAYRGAGAGALKGNAPVSAESHQDPLQKRGHRSRDYRVRPPRHYRILGASRSGHVLPWRARSAERDRHVHRGCRSKAFGC